MTLLSVTVSPTLGFLVCRHCGRLNLLGEDVGVTGVPGDFGDHAQVDESQAHGADDELRSDVERFARTLLGYDPVTGEADIPPTID